ncbi:Nitrogen permease reactivator protein [Castilleja foliolosa]|uniref:Nitrogen permease reactivator protein n=1 Tax=Castilleja foliolosa TaxID=1961234 RepID=A0ABD3ELL8_9LAMI
MTSSLFFSFESDITLDEPYALHYAVAYCDPKIVAEVLSLGLGDVNLRLRIRSHPIIVSLLNKWVRIGSDVRGTECDYYLSEADEAEGLSDEEREGAGSE